MQVIIYKNDEGNMSVITPTNEFLNAYGIYEIALKDVPHGKPFGIVDSKDIPDVIDESKLVDGIGAEYSTF